MEENTKTYRARITGMHCAACSARIERVVGNLEGVESCSVNLAAEKAVIGFDPTRIGPADLETAISRLGFGAEEELEEDGSIIMRDVEDDSLPKRRQSLVPMFILAMAIMILSMGPMVGVKLPVFLAAETAPGSHALVQLLLLLPVLYLGRNFYTNGIPALFRRSPNMDSLIAIGTGAATVYSLWNSIEIFLGVDPVARAHDLYYESAAVLLALISLGKYLEARSKARTSEAIRKLMDLAPETATVVDEDGKRREIALQDVRVGDRLLIRPGERIGVDGTVVEGTSAVDEAMLTGEPIPVVKAVGDNLYTGTLNTTGALTMEAALVGRDTVLARIVRLVQDAQGSKAPIANLADRISLYFVPAVILLALVSGLAWYLLGGETFSFSLRIFIAVLVIACPCAMGLATPTSIMVGTGRGAQLGVLVRTGEVLERAEKCTTVVFDKTGTLTAGHPRLMDLITIGAGDELTVLRYAASLERDSEHPLAHAVLEEAKLRGIQPLELEGFTATPGKGVSGTVMMEGERRDLMLGNRGFLEHAGVELEEAGTIAEEYGRRGHTVLYLAVDGRLAGLLTVADPLKEESAAEVQALREMGLSIVMLTGDNETTARAVAAEVGIERVVAGVMPEKKAEEIARLQEDGEIVVMVGDGINDAPALARADVGVAMGSGIDVAVESADMVLMNDHLDGVRCGIGLSRATMRNIRQNLFWAFAYNVIGIPVAAGLLHIFGGPTLNPMIGGAAMALSSVSVVTNSLRLRWYKPER